MLRQKVCLCPELQCLLAHIVPNFVVVCLYFLFWKQPLLICDEKKSCWRGEKQENHGKTGKTGTLETKHIQIGSFEFAMRSLNLGFDAQIRLENGQTPDPFEAPEAKFLY